MLRSIGRRQRLGSGGARATDASRASFEGAMPTMLVLKRLAVLAVSDARRSLASEGAALAGLGQPSPWQIGLQQSASPVMENIIWFHDFSALHHHRHHRFRAGVAGDRDGALQCPRQSHSIPDHAQHIDRDRLDDHPDRHPDGHRGALVQASVLPAQYPGCRRDREGDGQAVVLELQLSGQRPVRVRFADAQGGRAQGRASRGCSRSTTRWWCR